MRGRDAHFVPCTPRARRVGSPLRLPFFAVSFAIRCCSWVRFLGTTRPVSRQGCIELLDRSGVEISGKQAVVIGRSNIVGMPAGMLLMKRNATVTIVHSGARCSDALARAAGAV